MGDLFAYFNQGGATVAVVALMCVIGLAGLFTGVVWIVFKITEYVWCRLDRRGRRRRG